MPACAHRALGDRDARLVYVSMLSPARLQTKKRSRLPELFASHGLAWPLTAGSREMHFSFLCGQHIPPKSDAVCQLQEGSSRVGVHHELASTLASGDLHKVSTDGGLSPLLQAEGIQHPILETWKQSFSALSSGD